MQKRPKPLVFFPSLVTTFPVCVCASPIPLGPDSLALPEWKAKSLDSSVALAEEAGFLSLDTRTLASLSTLHTTLNSSSFSPRSPPHPLTILLITSGPGNKVKNKEPLLQAAGGRQARVERAAEDSGSLPSTVSPAWKAPASSEWVRKRGRSPGSACCRACVCARVHCTPQAAQPQSLERPSEKASSQGRTM